MNLNPTPGTFTRAPLQVQETRSDYCLTLATGYDTGPVN